MRQTKIMVSALLLGLGVCALSSCSSDGPEVPKVKFSKSASDLNDNLRDSSSLPQIDGGMTFHFFITAHEESEVELESIFGWISFEIPGKGGLYDMRTFGPCKVKRISVYEDIHNVSDFLSREEFFDFEPLFIDRKPDVLVNFDGSDDPKGFGDLSVTGDTSFTYRFPENNTGKPRLIFIDYDEYRYGPMTTAEIIYDWYGGRASFIQYPD